MDNNFHGNVNSRNFAMGNHAVAGDTHNHLADDSPWARLELIAGELAALGQGLPRSREGSQWCRQVSQVQNLANRRSPDSLDDLAHLLDRVERPAPATSPNDDVDERISDAVHRARRACEQLRAHHDLGS